MKLVIENYGDATLYKEYPNDSLSISSRWVVEWKDGRQQIYSRDWYSLEKVTQLVEKQLSPD